MLELHGVSKSFGAVQALYKVDFHVSPGEVMALVGDNGAGKSTLIKCIAGIHPIDEGKIVFTFLGKKVRGEFVLTRMSRNPKHWLLIKRDDKFADVEWRLKTVLPT